MEGLEQRLARLEARLDRLEHLLREPRPAADTGEPTFSFRADRTAPPPAGAPTPQPPRREESAGAMGGAITRLLGWSGSLALVMAVAYLLKLAYDSGWLTLSAQARIVIALLCSAGLIGSGLYLRKRDRHYASLLPAAGIAILFLTIYGAHLYYHLIKDSLALPGVALACLLCLWLCRRFDSDLFALFAISGSYSAPFLIQGVAPGAWSVLLYFSFWGVGFCLFSLLAGRRRYYLLALYLALIGFEFAWRTTAPYDWPVAAIFQTVQAGLFGLCAAFFSIRHRRRLTMREAALHLPALLIFYVLQYHLLHRHLPGLAPWLALGSVALLGLAAAVWRQRTAAIQPGARFLLVGYGTLALMHAGYLELTPPHWRPWLALLALPAVLGWLAARRSDGLAEWPLPAALGLLWLVGFTQAVGDRLPDTTPGGHLLGLFHALELYGGYALLRRYTGKLRHLSVPLIYAGHLAAMAAAWRILPGSLGVSLAWGLLSLICLGLALAFSDRRLGQSSLLLFAFSALKVLLFDLADATPPARIGCLVVVGVTFYIGGWLYRRIENMASTDGS